jgi:hypothetical protein
MPRMPVELLDGAAAATVRGDVIMLIWKGAAQKSTVQRAMVLTESLSAEHPGGILIFQVILPSSDPPNAEARAIVNAGFKRIRPNIRALVSVGLGDSFRMSIVRTIMRATAALSGLGAIQVIEATEAAGLRRLLHKAGPETPPQAELEAALAEMREKLGA